MVIRIRTLKKDRQQNGHTKDRAARVPLKPGVVVHGESLKNEYIKVSTHDEFPELLSSDKLNVKKLELFFKMFTLFWWSSEVCKLELAVMHRTHNSFSERDDNEYLKCQVSFLEQVKLQEVILNKLVKNAQRWSFPKHNF